VGTAPPSGKAALLVDRRTFVAGAAGLPVAAWSGVGDAAVSDAGAVEHLDATDFGVQGDDVTDNTQRLQELLWRANDEAQRRGRTPTVYLPAGRYRVHRVILPRFVRLVGAGMQATQLKPIRAAAPAHPRGLVEIAAGPVTHGVVAELSLVGSDDGYGGTPVNPDQWAFYLHARFDENEYHGGLWRWTFRRINVRGFNRGLWSRGGYTWRHSRLPNQYTDYRQVYFQLSAEGPGAFLSGQHGQVTFRSCEFKFAHGERHPGPLVHVGSDPDPQVSSPRWDERLGDEAHVPPSARAPTGLVFDAMSFVGGTVACHLDGTRGATFTGCWFELNDTAVRAEGGATFSGHGGSFRTGREQLPDRALFELGDGAMGSWHGANVYGRYHRMNLIAPTSRGLRTRGWTHNFRRGEEDSFFAYDAPSLVPDANGRLDLGIHPVVHLERGETPLRSIVSGLTAGESVHVIIGGRDVPVASTVNISYPANLPMLAAGSVYQLTNIANAGVSVAPASTWSVVGSVR